MAMEIAGGSLVGFFASAWANSWEDGARLSLAFGSGLGWSKIVQVARKKITDVVEAAFGINKQGNPSESEK
jgi:hypothetical protein